MAKNVIQTEDERVTVVANATFTAGAFIVRGQLRGVALNSGVSGDLMILQRRGVARVAKATGAGTDFAVGAALEWAASPGNLVALNTGTHVATVLKACATGDAVAEVVLVA